MFYKKLIISCLLYNFINFITLQTLKRSTLNYLLNKFMKLKKSKNFLFMNKLVLKIFIFYFFLTVELFSQNILLTGKITDMQEIALASASVFAEPISNGNIEFAITNESGKYEIKLKKNKKYLLKFSYLGFKTIEIEKMALENETLNIQLEELFEQLGEVIIKHTPPIIVKKDTIIYNADSFVTGNERKLKDVLEKLPMLELDNNGNVFVNNKKITKVLVEDKIFFSGDSKLAIENIPADAIDKIEFIDDYQEISFFKGLEKSDEYALNIKLKKEKKQFYFGDISLGYGLDKFYTLNADVFKYAERSNLVFISDVNNIGKSAFNLKNYFEFEGGIKNVLFDNESMGNVFSGEMYKYLVDDNFFIKKNLLSALNYNQNLNKKSELSSYIIYTKYFQNQREEDIYSYLYNNSKQFQDKSNSSENQLILYNFKYNYRRNDNTVLDYKFILKSNNSSTENIVNTYDLFYADKLILSHNENKNTNWNQMTSLNKKWNINRITKAKLNLILEKKAISNNWILDYSFFSDLIPLIVEESNNIQNNKSISSKSFHIEWKEYVKINNTNHLYLSLGSKGEFEHFNTEDFQILSNNTNNDFGNVNFNNNINRMFFKNYLGIEYKRKIKKLIIKPKISLFIHNSNISQTTKYIKNNTIVIPAFNSEYEISSTKNITFDYSMNTVVPTIEKVSEKYTLYNYNKLYKGDYKIENQIGHRFLFKVNYFKPFNRLFLGFTSNYTTKNPYLTHAFIAEGFDIIKMPILSKISFNEFLNEIAVRKRYSKFDFSIKVQIKNVKYHDFLNDSNQEILLNSRNIITAFSTFFKNVPNINVYYSKGTNSNYTPQELKYGMHKMIIKIDSKISKNISFLSEFKYDVVRDYNNNTINRFPILNTNLSYFNYKKPISIDINFNNVLDVRTKEENSINEIFYSSSKIYIMPSVFILKLTYKF